MIIVSGYLRIKAGERKKFLTLSTNAMKQARNTLGCRDFVVAADPLDGDRVNIYEEWDSEEALVAFRGSGPDDVMVDLIKKANVGEYRIGST